MTTYQYPGFVEGQTLTATELNGLVAHVRHRDQQLGLVTGFGVSCGLRGTFSGSTLTIDRGRAVDQVGQALISPMPLTLSFPHVEDLPSFPNVTESEGGFSVVLQATDTVEPAPSCTEDDCAGHAELHTTGVTLSVAKGRLVMPGEEFAHEPLLAQEPLRLSLTSQPIGSYTTLRNAIVSRLRNSGSPLVNSTLIDQLQATSIPSSDLPGVKGYKAGWLNMVFFAALEALRCRALMDNLCRVGEAPTAGVVLGWAHLVGNTWIFSCNDRHHWQPGQGLVMALLGSSCPSPCAVLFDQLEALISGYSPPDPPPPADDDDDDDGGGITVYWCPDGRRRRNGPCLWIDPPPLDYPGWRDHFVGVLDDMNLGDFNRSGGWTDPQPDWSVHADIYGLDPMDEFHDGVMGMGTLVGRGPKLAVRSLREGIKNAGGHAQVMVVKQQHVATLEDFEVSTAAGLSDTMVLVTGSDGRVAYTGRMPARKAMRQVGTVVPAAQEAAAVAVGAVATVSELVAEVDNRIVQFEGSVSTVDAKVGQLRTEFDQYKIDGFDQSEVGARLTMVERDVQQVAMHGERLAILETRVEVGGKTPSAGFDTHLAERTAEYTQTMLEALKSFPDSNNKNYKEYVATVERAQGKFEMAMSGDDVKAMKETMLGLMDSLRTAVKAGGASDAAGRKVDAQYRMLRDDLT